VARGRGGYLARVLSRSAPRHLLAVDVVLATALLVVGEVAALSGPSSLPPWSSVALTAAYTGPLALRRAAPASVCVAVFGAVIALGVLDPDGSQPTIPFAVALASFTLGRYAPAVPSRIVGVSALAGFWAAYLATGATATDLVISTLIYGAPWAFGVALRSRAARTEQQAAEAVSAERGRIARELHDIVAHSLSVVTLQTEAVRRRLTPDQRAEAGDLREVEQTAREALADMRRLLGVLRAAADPAPLAPQPSIADLEPLLAQTRRAGIAVDAFTAGTPVSLGPGTALAGYRIVQEALTNVRRHARATAASVTLSYAPDHLDIDVADNGSAATHPPVAGHGLIGLRERVRLFGGELTAGPAASGGFRVHARLPLSDLESPQRIPT
jgi:signal transduction histidine kinase